MVILCQSMLSGTNNENKLRYDVLTKGTQSLSNILGEYNEQNWENGYLFPT